MTIQQKRTIEISDILAFCFTCKHCKVSMSIPAFSRLATGKPYDCPSCHREWSTSDGPIAHFSAFKNALDIFSESIRASDGFTLAIEISPDPVSTARSQLIVSPTLPVSSAKVNRLPTNCEVTRVKRSESFKWFLGVARLLNRKDCSSKFRNK